MPERKYKGTLRFDTYRDPPPSRPGTVGLELRAEGEILISAETSLVHFAEATLCQEMTVPVTIQVMEPPCCCSISKLLKRGLTRVIPSSPTNWTWYIYPNSDQDAASVIVYCPWCGKKLPVNEEESAEHFRIMEMSCLTK